MSLYFDCLELLGLTQTCQFWGTNINYRNIQEYTARGRMSGDPNATVIAPAWSNMSGLMTYFSGYMPIYAQGILLGTGKITQLQFDAGTDVRYKPFTASFQILKSGDLSNVTGSTYSGLQPAFSFFPYLNSLTEDYQFSQTDSITTEFTRNLSFGLEQGYINQVSGSHLLGSIILGALTDLGIYTPPMPPQFSGVDGVVRNLSQTIDIINGEFSYSETFNYQSGRNYTHDYRHSLNYDENGITTVSEEGSVQSTRRVSGTGSRMDFAVSGWNQVLAGVFPRVSGVFARWESEFQNSGCPLDILPLERNITRDFSRGLLTYGYTYSNDAAYRSGFYHTYEQSLDITDQGWITTKVNGEIQYRKTDPSGALDAVTNYYRTQVQPNVTGYARAAYTGSVNYFKSPYCSGGYTGTLAPVSSQESYTDRPVSIEYEYIFTDDPSYIATGLFRQIKNTLTNEEIVPLVNIFRLFNYIELPQDSQQSNPGVLRNSIEMIGSSGVSIDQYKLAASGRLVKPTGAVYWMTENTYNYSPNGYKFSMDVAYNYEGYRQINDFNL